MIRNLSRSLVAMAAMLLAGQAQAGPVECEAIQNAYKAVASVPGYRQVVDMPGLSTKMESVVIGDMIYARMDDKWRKIPLKPGGRIGMLTALLDMTSIFDCKELRSETLPAGRVKVFEYMMTPPKGLPGAGTKPARQVAWIGVTDGLVHRMTSDDTTIELDFRTQIPPIP